MPTVTKVHKMPGMTGNFSVGQVSPIVVKWQVTFAKTDYLTAVPNDCIAASDGTTTMPAAFSSINSTYPFYVLLKLDAVQSEVAPWIWNCTLTYAPNIPGLTPQQPTAGKYDVNISGTLLPREYPVTIDRDGQAIVNSAQETITGITQTDYDESITVSFHHDTPPWTLFDSCKGKANSSAVTMTIKGVARSFAKHTLKLENINWSIQFNGLQQATIGVDLVFTYRPDTWTVLPVNQGFNHLDPDGNLVANTNDDGTLNTTNMMYLDFDGSLLADGSEPTIAGDGAGFENITDTDFSALLSEVVT